MKLCLLLSQFLAVATVCLGQANFQLEPDGQDVPAGFSVLLKSFATGAPPLRYQWWHEGFAIPLATNQMLALESATAPDSGNYFVTVANDSGAVTSRIAVLEVTLANPGALLSARNLSDTNLLEITVRGHRVGMPYTVQHSTNLIDWSETPPKWTAVTPTNGVFQVLRSSPGEFWRVAQQFDPATEICISHLEQINFAIWEFAQDHHPAGDVPVTFVDLMPYLIGGRVPECPVSSHEFDFDYTLSSVTNLPTCRIHPWNHKLD